MPNASPLPDRVNEHASDSVSIKTSCSDNVTANAGDVHLTQGQEAQDLRGSEVLHDLVDDLG